MTCTFSQGELCTHCFHQFPVITHRPFVSSCGVISKYWGHCRSLTGRFRYLHGIVSILWAEEKVHTGGRKLEFILLIVLAFLPVSLQNISWCFSRAWAEQGSSAPLDTGSTSWTVHVRASMTLAGPVLLPVTPFSGCSLSVYVGRTSLVECCWFDYLIYFLLYCKKTFCRVDSACLCRQHCMGLFSGI